MKIHWPYPNLPPINLWNLSSAIFVVKNLEKSASVHGQAARSIGMKQEQILLAKTGILAMTTIAYKDGIIAYDSRATAGDVILDDDFEKSVDFEGAKFFLAGAISDFEKFVECFIHDRKPPKDMDVSAFVVFDNTLWKASVDNIGLWKHKLEINKAYAIGNGEQFALAAMDLGRSAKDAVQAAIKRDTKTGGKVRTFDIRGLIHEEPDGGATKERETESSDLELGSKKTKSRRKNDSERIEAET